MVRTVVRVRPLSVHERLNADVRGDSCPEAVVVSPGDKVVVVKTSNKSIEYSCDHVYSGLRSDELADKELPPILDGLLDGFNACILGLGPTGSGKSHTFGCEGSAWAEKNGVIPSALRSISLRLAQRDDLEARLLIYEIYQGKQKSLMPPQDSHIHVGSRLPETLRSPGKENLGRGEGSRGGRPPPGPAAVPATPLTSQRPRNFGLGRVPFTPSTTLRKPAPTAAGWAPAATARSVAGPAGTTVTASVADTKAAGGLEPVVVGSLQEARGLWEHAVAQREVASTAANNTSSRSHLVVELTLHRRRPPRLQPQPLLPQGHGQGQGQQPAGPHGDDVPYAKLMLVDLAGNERVKQTGAEGVHLSQACANNEDLLHLNRVLEALADKSRPTKHVPYRNCTLTRILEPALCGKSLTCIVACISPAACKVAATIDTLSYADRARGIISRPVRAQHLPGPVSAFEQLLEKQLATEKDEKATLARQLLEQQHALLSQEQHLQEALAQLSQAQALLSQSHSQPQAPWLQPQLEVAKLEAPSCLGLGIILQPWMQQLQLGAPPLPLTLLLPLPGETDGVSLEEGASVAAAAAAVATSPRGGGEKAVVKEEALEQLKEEADEEEDVVSTELKNEPWLGEAQGVVGAMAAALEVLPGGGCSSGISSDAPPGAPLLLGRCTPLPLSLLPFDEAQVLAPASGDSPGAGAPWTSISTTAKPSSRPVSSSRMLTPLPALFDEVPLGTSTDQALLPSPLHFSPCSCLLSIGHSRQHYGGSSPRWDLMATPVMTPQVKAEAEDGVPQWAAESIMLDSRDVSRGRDGGGGCSSSASSVGAASVRGSPRAEPWPFNAQAVVPLPPCSVSGVENVGGGQPCQDPAVGTTNTSGDGNSGSDGMETTTQPWSCGSPQQPAATTTVSPVQCSVTRGGPTGAPEEVSVGRCQPPAASVPASDGDAGTTPAASPTINPPAGATHSWPSQAAGLGGRGICSISISTGRCLARPAPPTEAQPLPSPLSAGAHQLGIGSSSCAVGSDTQAASPSCSQAASGHNCSTPAMPQAPASPAFTSSACNANVRPSAPTTTATATADATDSSHGHTSLPSPPAPAEEVESRQLGLRSLAGAVEKRSRRARDVHLPMELLSGDYPLPWRQHGLGAPFNKVEAIAKPAARLSQRPRDGSSGRGTARCSSGRSGGRTADYSDPYWVKMAASGWTKARVPDLRAYVRQWRLHVEGGAGRALRAALLATVTVHYRQRQ